MKISKTFIIICMMFATLNSFAQLTISTNKTDNSFTANEQMQFIIKADTSGQATYKIQYHELAPAIESGSITLTTGSETILNFTLPEPGVAHCIVEIGEKSVMAGASFSAYDIAPFEEIPDDFQTFWNEKKIKLADVPIEPVIWLKESSEFSKTYFLNLANISGRNIYGYISVPEGDGPFPAILTLPSAGNHPDAIFPQASYAENANAISVAISIHSNPISQEALYAYQHEALNDPDGNYFRYGMLAAIRAIDYIYTRPDFDQENLAVNGTSQGGGLALLLAGIDDRVDLLISGTPALCEHSGLLYDRAAGWPSFYAQATWQGANEQYLHETVAAAKYYDAVYAARFFDGPALMAISYNDDIVPPATSWAAFNQLGSDHKIMAHALDIGHYAPPDFWRDQMDMLTRYWPDAVVNAPAPRATLTTGYFANAGQDLQVAPNTPLTIEGTVTRDGTINESWPVEWTKISGPGEVTFSNSLERTTTANFNATGTYYLRFKAADAISHLADKTTYAVMDVVKIIVGDGSIPFQSQAIDFEEIPIQFNTSEDFELVATASSGLPVTFTVVGGPATINGSTVMLDSVPGYVTIQAHQSGNIYYAPASAWQTFEIQYDETPPVETCVEINNIALDKTATQSGTQHDAAADRAIDGNTNGNFWLTLTATNSHWVPNAWWEIDLGAIHRIEQINLWNRTDCCIDFTENYHVLVSEEPFVSESLAMTLAQDGVTDFFQNESVDYPTEIPMEITGRYVRVQLAGTAFLSLAEVEIFGCAMPETASRQNENSLLKDKHTQHTDLKLFPNPANGYILLEAKNYFTNKATKCHIFNALGQAVLDVVLEEEKEQTEIDVKNLTSGVYYVMIEGNDGKRVVRAFVKE